MNNSIFHLKGAASGPKSLRPGEGAICGFHWPLRAPLERGAWSRNPEISAPSGLDARLRGHDEKTTQKVVTYTESRLVVKANLMWFAACGLRSPRLVKKILLQDGS
jgi:hypothetical protein